MTRTLLALAALTLAAATAHAADPLGRNHLPGDALWDDGRAEVCVYDATGPKEGATHQFSATSFVVKEDMELAQRVKSDAGPVAGKTVEVLKMNFFADIPTGVYAHHLMSSAFYERASWQFAKLATSSQDGCGLTYTETLPRGAMLVRTAHSYWDGQADRTDSLSAADGPVIMDAMPLWLRGMNLFWRGSIKMPVVPTQTHNRLQPFAATTATVEFLGKEPVTVPAGKYDEAVHIHIATDKTQDDLWFDARSPFPLVRWWRADGTRFELRKYLRLDYWNYAKPGDEKLLR